MYTIWDSLRSQTHGNRKWDGDFQGLREGEMGSCSMDRVNEKGLERLHEAVNIFNTTEQQT